MDAARVQRAVHLTVDDAGEGLYLVSGGAAAHVVNLEAGTCDCTDFAVHGGPCKHLVACRLVTGDREALAMLREIVPLPKRRKAGGMP